MPPFDGNMFNTHRQQTQNKGDRKKKKRGKKKENIKGETAILAGKCLTNKHKQKEVDVKGSNSAQEIHGLTSIEGSDCDSKT